MRGNYEIDFYDNRQVVDWNMRVEIECESESWGVCDFIIVGS